MDPSDSEACIELLGSHGLAVKRVTHVSGSREVRIELEDNYRNANLLGGTSALARDAEPGWMIDVVGRNGATVSIESGSSAIRGPASAGNLDAELRGLLGET